MISGAGGGIGGKIYKWKRYELNSKTVYTWNVWNHVETTIYKWNKWNAITQNYDGYVKNDTIVSVPSNPVYSGYTYNGTDFSGTGYIGTVSSNYSSIASNGWYIYPANLGFTDSILKPTSYNGKNGYGNYTFTGYTYSSKYMTGSTMTTFPGNSNGSTVQGSTSYGQVTSTSPSAYPSNGASGSYWYVSAGSEVQHSKGSTKYSDVTSTSSSAYPDNGYLGSYWYNNKTSSVEHSMGAYKDTVYSTNRNQYPDNGHDASYWYVFDGES